MTHNAIPQPPTAEANSAVAVNSGRFNGDNVPRPTSPPVKIKPKETRYRFPLKGPQEAQLRYPEKNPKTIALWGELNKNPAEKRISTVSKLHVCISCLVFEHRQNPLGNSGSKIAKRFMDVEMDWWSRGEYSSK